MNKKGANIWCAIASECFFCFYNSKCGNRVAETNNTEDQIFQSSWKMLLCLHLTNPYVWPRQSNRVLQGDHSPLMNASLQQKSSLHLPVLDLSTVCNCCCCSNSCLWCLQFNFRTPAIPSANCCPAICEDLWFLEHFTNFLFSSLVRCDHDTSCSIPTARERSTKWTGQQFHTTEVWKGPLKSVFKEKKTIPVSEMKSDDPFIVIIVINEWQDYSRKTSFKIMAGAPSSTSDTRIQCRTCDVI